MMMKFIHFLVILFVVNVAVKATDRLYVNNLLGSDSLDGKAPHPGGKSGPFRTIQRALNVAGTAGRIDIANTGLPYKSGNRLTTGGHPGAPLVIEGNGAVICGLEDMPAKEWQPAGPGMYKRSFWPMSNYLKLDKTYTTWPGAPQVWWLNGRPARNCSSLEMLRHTPGGFWWNKEEKNVWMHLPEGATIEAVRISLPVQRNGGTGFNVSGNAAHVEVHNLRSEFNFNDGFSAHDNVTDLVFKNCVAADNCGQGFSFHGNTQVTVEDGLASRNASSGACDVGAGRVTYRRCVFANNSFEAGIFAAENTTVSYEDCLITGNQPFEQIWQRGKSAMKLTNCVISGAGTGKSLVLTEQGSVECKNCTFTDAPGLAVFRHGAGKLSLDGCLLQKLPAPQPSSQLVIQHTKVNTGARLPQKVVDLYKKVDAGAPQVFFCGPADNDLYVLMQQEGFRIKRFNKAADAVAAAGKGDAVFIVAGGYPRVKTAIPASLPEQAKQKGLKVYLEYPAIYADTPVHTQLERGVVTSTVFNGLPPMSILGINDCYVLPVKADGPLIVLAKVAGFDKAAYGISDVPQYPLLFEDRGMLVAATSFSSFARGRYGPGNAWQKVWSYILWRMTGRDITRFREWPVHVAPSYERNEPLPADAQRKSVERGVQWFYKGRFFIHPSWKALWQKYQGDGTNPAGPPLTAQHPNGDGSLGLLEGHVSRVYHDGSQQYRYWIRADVQGEAAYALAAAGKLLGNDSYKKAAVRLTDFVLNNSNMLTKDTASPTRGLIGWSVTHPQEFYGDDNARAVLGIIGASANLGTDKWNKAMVEAILANFRTTGIKGFRGNRLRGADIQKNGWKYFGERDVFSPAPHFESWMWALYLWLYDKTGYKPLLDKTKTAIRLTMEAYPDKWKWTNGIQQERARMVLPLAWLLRVENTPEHRRWLDTMVQALLRNQDASGAIREELGAGAGKYGRTASNKEYGLREAPLIFDNGDPVADMLYTTNFAFFSLNEAAHAAGNGQYKAAVTRLAAFLTRIQVKSERHPDLDGAWFRAFDYQRWEYWASNADAGWGAWGTLTGWTQSWIVATQILTLQGQSYWEQTKDTDVKKFFPAAVAQMLEK